MAGQLTLQATQLDFPLTNNLSLAFTFREHSQVTLVTSTQFPQTRPVLFTSDFFSLSDQVNIKVKTGNEIVAGTDIVLQGFFDVNSKENERWVDVFSVPNAQDKKRKYLPLGGKESEKVRRLGRIRVKMILEMQGELSPAEHHTPASILPKATSPPQRPSSRDASPKRPSSVHTKPVPRPSSGALSPIRPPSRSESVKDFPPEADLSLQHNLSMDLSDSFKIDLVEAMENQSFSPYLHEDPGVDDHTDCPRCMKLKQLAVFQEKQINAMLETMWREHNGLLSAVSGETLPVMTRFALGRSDPTTMVAVPLPGEGLSRTESEVYQKVLHALNSQLKIMQLAEHEEELLKGKIEVSKNSRAELMTSMKETQLQMEKLGEKKKEIVERIGREKEEIGRDAEMVEKNLKRKMEDVFELSEDLAQLQAEEESRQREAGDYQKIKAEVEKVYREMGRELDLREALEKEYSSLESTQYSALTSQLRSVSQSRSCNTDLHQQIAALRSQLTTEQSRHESLLSESQELKTRLSLLTADRTLVQDDTDTIAHLQTSNKLITAVQSTTTASLTSSDQTYESSLTSVADFSHTLQTRKSDTSTLLSEARNLLELRLDHVSGIS